MSDDIKNMVPVDMPKIGIDLTTSYKMSRAALNALEENRRNSMRMSQEAYEYRQRELRALEETASNTSDSKEHLRAIIEQQEKQIKLLEKQLEIGSLQLV